jgi:hypothetical protein
LNFFRRPKVLESITTRGWRRAQFNSNVTRRPQPAIERRSKQHEMAFAEDNQHRFVCIQVLGDDFEQDRIARA